MRKTKVYLDTSILSHLFADDAPDKMQATNALWEDFKKDKYEIIISETVIRELHDCPEPKRSKIQNKLNEIKYQVLDGTAEVVNLAQAYLDENVLTIKSIDDCMHIAFAVIENCDFVVSWNFKHLVNVRTINKVKIVNAINNYKEISIISPMMLAEEV